MLSLKYDVYYEFTPGGMTLYELIPVKRKWQLSFDPSLHADVKELMESIARGMDDDQVAQVQGFARKVLEFLLNKGLISSMDSSEHRTNPFLRQIEVFDSWNRTDRSPFCFQELLTNASILVIGAGGVGSTLVSLLCSVGIGRVFCVDFDRIEIHNLARQALYTQADLGKFKVEVLAQRCNARGLTVVTPIVERLTSENVGRVLDQCGHVTAVTGLPLPNNESVRRLYVQILARGIPILCVGEHDVGPFLTRVDDIDRYSEWVRRAFQLASLWAEQRQFKAALNKHPSYAPGIAIVCATAVDQLVRRVTGLGEVATARGFYSLDPVTGELKRKLLREGDDLP